MSAPVTESEPMHPSAIMEAEKRQSLATAIEGEIAFLAEIIHADDVNEADKRAAVVIRICLGNILHRWQGGNSITFDGDTLKINRT